MSKPTQKSVESAFLKLYDKLESSGFNKRMDEAFAQREQCEKCGKEEKIGEKIRKCSICRGTFCYNCMVIWGPHCMCSVCDSDNND